MLELEGYRTANVATPDQALDLLQSQHFDAILIDIKLADKSGLYLLQRLQKITPETIKIVITGCPSVCSIVDALDLGANGYIMKPVTPQELIQTIRSKIEARKQFENTAKKEPADTQVTTVNSKSFPEFLQKMTDDLATFGLTTNQAKIYVTSVAVGPASASEIAKISRVRREEVYRIICELEKTGIITRKMDKPHKFSALTPEDATLILIKSKLSKAAQEIDALDAKRNIITSNLKKLDLFPAEIEPSIDTIPSTENLNVRLIGMAKRAKKKIDAILTYQSILQMYWTHETYRSDERKNCAAQTASLPSATARIITESRACADQSNLLLKKSLFCSELSVKFMEQVPFNAFMVDEAEVLWGQFDLREKNCNLWATDQVQITILKTAFESLWKDAKLPSFN